MCCFVVLSGIFISKLAVDPLSEYVKSLQNLSKETLHELNLPVSTIKSNATMISKSLSDEKSLKRGSRIEAACKMLEQRYNELDYMIKTQSLQEIYEEIELDILLQERVDFLQALYPQITFNLKLQKSKIFNDKIGLSKVIDNIIDNGVKYSKNSTQLEIEVQGTTLSIRDYGCGMDEVELLQIFDTYYQSNENMKGFGIGLSMVKRFCDTNEIKLNFKSQKEKGTTVLLQFKQI
jgi:signal transduction histidine kinase